MEYVPVGILFVQEFLEQLSGANYRFLKLTYFWLDQVLVKGLLENLPGFQAVDKIGDNAAQVVNQVSFFLKERALIKVPELLKVINLYVSPFPTNGLEFLPLAPAGLAEIPGSVFQLLEYDPCNGPFGVLPGIRKDMYDLPEGFIEGFSFLENLCSPVNACQFLEPFLFLGNDPFYFSLIIFSRHFSTVSFDKEIRDTPGQ